MADEYSIHLNIEQVENGEYLATSVDLPGLVAQGRTVTETMEIAQDVARKLIESYREHGDPLPATMKRIASSFEIDLPVGL
jgi:antitoxin HicB